jgi:glycosyltransferase involved in cell wall biosynthesis
LLTDLAEGLAAAGHEVVVVTAAHREGIAREEVRAGVRILRVVNQPRSRAAKFWAFLLFHPAAALAILRRARRGDAVVVMTDPPLIGVSAGIAALFRGAKLIHWTQDVYPEIAAALTPHRWLRGLSGVRNALWRRATVCVTLGTDMRSLLEEAGVGAERLSVAPNWAPAGIRALPRGKPSNLRAHWGLRGRFVVAYSGNLGRVHDLTPVLDLAQALRDDAVSFIFIGSGAGEADLRRGAAERRLTNVSFLPPQPRESLSESLAVADLHLVTLLPGCERLVFPSKLYGIAASGRPLLFIGPADCEVARTVREHDLGLTTTREKVAAAAGEILQLSRRSDSWERHAAAARAFAATHTAETAVARWTALLARLSGESPLPAGACPERAA